MIVLYAVDAVDYEALADSELAAEVLSVGLRKTGGVLSDALTVGLK
jgi:hypothetical protein